MLIGSRTARLGDFIFKLKFISNQLQLYSGACLTFPKYNFRNCDVFTAAFNETLVVGTTIP